MNHCRSLFCFSVNILGILLTTSNIQAQVVTDASVNTIVASPNNLNFTITGGGTAGPNLFHSFTEFSIPTGGSALFDNALNIQNIFTRITGPNISNLDGALKANGTANLFLLNPKGVIFGPNATLNIGGSFLTTTANTIKFADGGEFSATNPNPLLTVSVPIGLQMGANPRPINIQGSNLQVQSGQTIGLLGGDLTIDAANLTAPSGRLELGSVGPNSFVALNANQPQIHLDYQGVTAFQNINLINGASPNASGNIQIQGRNILIRDGAQIRNQATSEGIAGNILLQASEQVSLIGTAPIGNPPSRITTEVLSNSVNTQGANITIAAPRIEISQGAIVQSGIDNATGSAGNITLKANTILVDGGATLDDASQISTRLTNGAIGTSGAITIEAQTLAIINGGFITTGAAQGSQSTGGNITVNAANINVDGSNFGPNRSGESTILTELAEEATGTGGDINIVAQQIRLNQGGNITSRINNNGHGTAGNITIQTDQLQAIGGVAEDFTSSGVYSIVNSSLKGLSSIDNQSGNIRIDARVIQLEGGGIINAGVFDSDAAAGTINVQAQTITASGVSSYGQESGFFANSFGNSFVGKSGAITIGTDSLQLNNGAKIVVGSLTSGRGNPARADAGDVIVQAKDITITGSNAVDYPDLGIFFNRSGIVASSGKGASGAGGSIQVTTDRLNILDGGEIIANTFTQGNAGSITIKASKAIQLDGNVPIDTSKAAFTYANPRSDDHFHSRISTSVEPNATGSSGILRLDTANLFLTNGSEITSSNLGFGNAGGIQINAIKQLLSNASSINVNGSILGNAGNLLINAGEIRLKNDAKFQAEVKQGNQGNINLNAQTIILRSGSQISTMATEAGSGGNIQINAPTLIGLENSDIIANAIKGRGGNIQITTQGIFGLKFRPQITPANDITASSQFGVNGTVQVNTIGVAPNSGLVALPVDLIDASQQIATGCSSNQGASFVITGRGGVPTNPIQGLNPDRPWQDPRNTTNLASDTRPETLIEATTWQLNPQGQPQLIAVNPTLAAKPNLMTCAN